MVGGKCAPHHIPPSDSYIPILRGAGELRTGLERPVGDDTHEGKRGGRGDRGVWWYRSSSKGEAGGTGHAACDAVRHAPMRHASTLFMIADNKGDFGVGVDSAFHTYYVYTLLQATEELLVDPGDRGSMARG
eukprot:8514440-Pyramimonas_sp.AAC.1